MRDNGAHIARKLRVGLPREKGEWSMKSFKRSGALAAILVAALLCLLAPRAGAQTGSISGTILDVNGKPWAEVVIRAVSDQGAKQETKTDSGGKFSLPNLRSGIYSVFIVFPPPNDKQAPFEAKSRVQSGEDAKVDLNFTDIVSKQGAEAQEQVQKAPADERDALKQKLNELSEQAVKEFQEASKNLVEKDPNAHLVWFKLGEAYDTAGRNDEAVQVYQQAIAAKSDVPGYYNNLGNVLARAGKIEEAKAAYTKSAELDPPNAATAWRNFGISLYNANRLGDAVEPFKKSAELDPKNAQTWYLLGASLVYKMTTKKVGDKEEVQFAPGTIEAYQKAVELDPNGTWGQQAKQGLEQLQLMAPGIDTKVNLKKKKS